MEWKPTIGKWNDEDNYDIKESLWRRMLNVASKYEEVKDVQEMLHRLSSRNLYGDRIRMYIIGYVLYQKNENLKEYLSDEMISNIHDFSAQSKSIFDYTVFVMKECHVSAAVIDEFRTSN